MKPHQWSKKTESRRIAETTVNAVTATPTISHDRVEREVDSATCMWFVAVGKTVDTADGDGGLE